MLASGYRRITPPATAGTAPAAVRRAVGLHAGSTAGEQGAVRRVAAADHANSARGPVRQVPLVVWAVVSIAGLLAETSFIVVLGRRVTCPYEKGTALDDGYPARRSHVVKRSCGERSAPPRADRRSDRVRLRTEPARDRGRDGPRFRAVDRLGLVRTHR